mgnify:CR=1 FL=1
MLKLFKRFMKQKKGFTLIELVAVLAILGMMAIMLTPSIDVATNRAKDTKMASDLVTVDSAVKLYQFEHGSLPASIEALKGDYLPNKDYKDAKNNVFDYDSAADNTFTLTGQKTNGDTVKADGSKATVSV